MKLNDENYSNIFDVSLNGEISNDFYCFYKNNSINESIVSNNIKWIFNENTSGSYSDVEIEKIMYDNDNIYIFDSILNSIDENKESYFKITNDFKDAFNGFIDSKAFDDFMNMYYFSNDLMKLNLNPFYSFPLKIQLERLWFLYPLLPQYYISLLFEIH